MKTIKHSEPLETEEIKPKVMPEEKKKPISASYVVSDSGSMKNTTNKKRKESQHKGVKPKPPVEKKEKNHATVAKPTQYKKISQSKSRNLTSSKNMATSSVDNNTVKKQGDKLAVPLQKKETTLGQSDKENTIPSILEEKRVAPLLLDDDVNKPVEEKNGERDLVVVGDSLENGVDNKNQSLPKEIYIVEKAVTPDELLVVNSAATSESAELVKPAMIENSHEPVVSEKRISRLNSAEGEINNQPEEMGPLVEQKDESTLNNQAYDNAHDQYPVVDNVSIDGMGGDEMESDESSQVFVVIKQGDTVEKIPATKINVDKLMADLNAILALNWMMVTPDREHRNDQRYAYCFDVLMEMRSGHYAAYSPYNVSSGDYSHWQQKLGEISLVQLVGQALNFYHLKDSSGKGVNVVETVFEADTKLSEMLVGIKKNNHYFSGVISFGVNSDQSLGGVGRFYDKKMINRFSWFLVEWNQDFYSLRLQKSNNNYDVLEITPLLSEQQKIQRNCRWKNSAG